jgi:hypothetical protein
LHPRSPQHFSGRWRESVTDLGDRGGSNDEARMTNDEGMPKLE